MCGGLGRGRSDLACVADPQAASSLVCISDFLQIIRHVKSLFTYTYNGIYPRCARRELDSSLALGPKTGKLSDGRTHPWVSRPRPEFVRCPKPRQQSAI
jgi:hypothetical protein